MKGFLSVVVVTVVVAFLVFVSGAAYTVDEREQVIITQFGKPVGEPVTTAGLKFKFPFIQQVNPIDKRILEWDGAPSNMPTKDKLYIAVDLLLGGALLNLCSSFNACAMNEVRSLVWTTYWALKHAMQWPSTN